MDPICVAPTMMLAELDELRAKTGPAVLTPLLERDGGRARPGAHPAVMPCNIVIGEFSRRC